MASATGWNHWLDGHEFDPGPGVSDGHGSWCVAIHAVTKRHDWLTEQQQFICCSLFKIKLFGTEWTVWSENRVSESCMSYGDCCPIFGSGVAVWGHRVSEVKRTVPDFSACPVVRTLSFPIKGMMAQVWPLVGEVRSHMPHLYYWKICSWRMLVASKPNLWWGISRHIEFYVYWLGSKRGKSKWSYGLGWCGWEMCQSEGEAGIRSGWEGIRCHRSQVRWGQIGNQYAVTGMSLVTFSQSTWGERLRKDF